MSLFQHCPLVLQCFYLALFFRFTMWSCWYPRTNADGLCFVYRTNRASCFDIMHHHETHCSVKWKVKVRVWRTTFDYLEILTSSAKSTPHPYQMLFFRKNTSRKWNSSLVCYVLWWDVLILQMTCFYLCSG